MCKHDDKANKQTTIFKKIKSSSTTPTTKIPISSLPTKPTTPKTPPSPAEPHQAPLLQVFSPTNKLATTLQSKPKIREILILIKIQDQNIENGNCITQKLEKNVILRRTNLESAMPSIPV